MCVLDRYGDLSSLTAMGGITWIQFTPKQKKKRKVHEWDHLSSHLVVSDVTKELEVQPSGSGPPSVAPPLPQPPHTAVASPASTVTGERESQQNSELVRQRMDINSLLNPLPDDTP